MRVLVGVLLTLSACSAERQPDDRAASPEAAAAGTVAAAPAAAAASTPLMAIPQDPEALKRLEAMGYTIHAEQDHLHAPGVNNCPQMGDDPVM